MLGTRTWCSAGSWSSPHAGPSMPMAAPARTPFPTPCEGPIIRPYPVDSVITDIS